MTPLLDPKLLDGLTAETPELQGMLDDARNLSVAVAQPGTTPLDSLHLRTLPISTTLHPAAAAAWATGLAASKTLGPFTDRLGRPAWIDVFKSVRNLRFERTAGAAPFIALPVDVVDVLRKPIGKGAPAAQTSFAIPAGSVWIKSQLLAPAAPATGYTGLKVKFGVLTFSAPVTIGATDEVVVPATVTATLDLTLDPPAPATGTGPGADARASAAAPPTEVRFAFDASSANLDRADSARLLAYGCDVSLALTGAAPVYVAEFNQIAFPAVPSVPNFHVAAVASSTFMPSGTAPITEGAWTVPVATVDPAHLGAATGAGALALALGTGLKATWLGQARAAALQACVISVDTQNLLVAATQARGERLRLQPKIGSAGGEQFNLSWGRQFPLSFASEAVGIEALWTDVLLDATFSKPVDLNGWRLPLHSDAANLLLLTTSQGTTLVIETGLTGGSQKLTSFSLVNGILKASWPSALYFAATFDGTTCKSGAVLLSYRFLGLLPTLPDPYASSAASWTGSDDGAITALYSLSRWTPTTSNFDFVVPATSVLPSGALAARGGIPGAPAATATGLSLPTTLNATPTAVTTAVVKNPLGDALQFENNSGFVLLDVSTHIDQFGVAVSQIPSVRTKLSIQNMQLELEASGVLLVTLPAVQWEPVHTEQDPGPGPFPEKLSFANSGVPTWVSVPTVNLVPVFPEAAIGRLVDNFALPAPNPAEMRFTMPFGMLARAHLKAANISASETRGAKLGLNRPTQGTLTGAWQLRIDAVDPALTPSQSPALPGFTVQLINGEPPSHSVLGDTPTTIFNTYLGSGEPSALVPVTRLDLSGYGESLFSDWTNPVVVSPSVERASFDVMIGRTAYEVVQVRTTLYPYAVTVVRTLTMERKNSATVVRRDSGWRAVGDGTYAFPPANAIATHPGVVRRITNVCNLRETGQIVTVDGIEIASVYFDGDLELDGVPTLVHVKDQVGFIQVTANVTLTPAIYAHALAVLGPLGGTVDANLKIGSGRIAMRLHRVDVAATQGMGGPEFVMASWGNLVFPGGGDWLFLRTDSPSSSPQAVAPTQGVPLIRAGVASVPPPASSPYRIADPQDLANPTNPAHDYGLVHATGTQRTFFSRPRVDTTATDRIVSTQIPMIADPYVLSTADGPFPNLAKTIPFPSNVWAFVVDAAGHYKLDIPASTFPVTVGRRTLKQAGSVKGDVDYTNAHITYTVDTSQAKSWSFALDGAVKIMNTSSLGDMIMLNTNIRAASDQPQTQFQQPQLKLGGALTIVQDLLTILADLGIQGFMTAQMTNAWSLKVKEKIPIVDAMGKPYQIPPIVPIPDIKFDDTDIEVEVDVAPSMDKAKFAIGGAPMFAVKQFPGLYVVGLIKFSIEISTADGTTYGLLIGFGLAYEIDADPFEFKGLFALTFFGFSGDTALGFGIGFLLKLGLSIEPLISIEIYLEGQLAVVWACRGTGHDTTFGVAKLTFGVEVTVCLIFSISFEVETTASTAISGPGSPTCALPDVLPSAS